LEVILKTVTNVAQVLVRFTGAIQIILGVIIWFGIADAFIPVHVVSGIILVLSFWTLAIIAARAGVNVGLAIFAIVWGLMAAVLGMIQEGLIPGQAHWIIQVIHLFMGMVVIGLGERLTRLIVRGQKSVVNQ
jgi:hypothetical protein